MPDEINDRFPTGFKNNLYERRVVNCKRMKFSFLDNYVSPNDYLKYTRTETQVERNTFSRGRYTMYFRDGLHELEATHVNRIGFDTIENK